jgi:hypothetical protein
MPRPARRVSPRAGHRDRHGRGGRSSVTGPHLPPLRTRQDVFDMTVASAMDYLHGAWADELAGVRVLVAAMPQPSPDGRRVERWRVSRRDRQVVLYRLTIERMAHLHKNDEWHRRSFIESCVFRAVAELLDKDPWDIAPERWRHF